MDKLFDLMTMTVKYQLETCITPNHLLSISLNHIDGIKKIMTEDRDNVELLRGLHNKVRLLRAKLIQTAHIMKVIVFYSFLFFAIKNRKKNHFN